MPSNPASVADYKSMVEELFALYSEMRVREADEKLFAPDAVWEIYPRTVGRKSPIALHTAATEAILAQYDHFHIWSTGMAVDGDTVKVSAESQGHHKTAGDYGQDYELTFHFRDGLCVYVREFVDSLYSREFFTRSGMTALLAPKA
jgi:ketosteroid isomerase-like protein